MAMLLLLAFVSLTKAYFTEGFCTFTIRDTCKIIQIKRLKETNGHAFIVSVSRVCPYTFPPLLTPSRRSQPFLEAFFRSDNDYVWNDVYVHQCPSIISTIYFCKFSVWTETKVETSNTVGALISHNIKYM